MFDWLWGNIHWLPPFLILALLLYYLVNAKYWFVRRFYFFALYSFIAAAAVAIVELVLPNEQLDAISSYTRPLLIIFIMPVLLSMIMAQFPESDFEKIFGHPELNENPQRYGNPLWWGAMVLVTGITVSAFYVSVENPVPMIHIMEYVAPGTTRHMREKHCAKKLAAQEASSEFEFEKKLLDIQKKNDAQETSTIDCLGYWK